MLRAIHPAVYVTAGFFLIVLVQTLDTGSLSWWGLVLTVFAVIFARGDWLRIVRRLRFIFLALLILFAWQTPGTMVLPFLGGFSPTWDGFRAAFDPAVRLLAIAAVVALMLRYLATEQWVSSLYVLVSPLQGLGLQPERFAVRLRLVLDYVEQRELNWRTCLTEAVQDSGGVSSETWSVQGLRLQDRVLLGILVLLLAGWLLW